MNIFKKTLSLLLIFTLCLSLSVYTAEAEGKADNNVSDIELLNMIGIFNGYEDGNLHPDWSITRMQFAALIVRALGYDGGAGQTQTEFSDVPADSWGSGYVKMAYDLGIVSGYGDKTFRPENPVTQAEAVKMLVAALGYGMAAEQKGGYPQGYIAMASRLDLLENAVSQTQQATRGYVATLIVNALETRFLEQVVNGDTMEKTDETILSRMGITVREGTLTAVYGASMSGGENLKKDEVIVSEEIFKTNLNISAGFIGNKVKIYVRDYGKHDELLICIMGIHSAESLTVGAEYIEDATTLSALVYEDKNGKIRTEALESGIKITYNGKLIDNSFDYTDARLKPQSGYVKLIDTDNNGSYDAAVVKDYETFVVKNITDKAIYGEFGNSIKYEDEDTIVTVIYNDMVCALSDIQPGDVLSGAVSIDGTIAEVIICREETEGVVYAKEDDANGIIYTLDTGEELRACTQYAAALSGGYKMAEKIELGSNMKFYLNHFGEIAAAVINTEGKDDGEYCYIIEMAKGGNAVSNIYEFKLLTEDNSYEIFETAKNGKVNFGRMVGDNYVVSRVSPEEIFNTVYFEGLYLERQMAKYVLNSDGAIKEFYLPDKNGGKEYFSVDSKKRSHLVANHLINGEYYWDDETVLFHIPLDGEYTTNLSSGKVDNYFSSGTVTIELYDIEPDGHIGCIYYHDSSTGRALSEGGTWNRIDYVNSPVMLVTKVYNEINDDGVDYCIVEGWENKQKVKKLLSDTLSKKATDIKAGSVIQYATNESIKQFANSKDDDVTIVSYAYLFDCNNPPAEEFMSYDYTAHHFANPRIKFGYSTVSRADNPYIRLAYDGALAEVHAGTMIYIYNRSSKEVTKGDFADINEGEKVFIRSRYSNLREVIVIED